jgi:hypothetical protein
MRNLPRLVFVGTAGTVFLTGCASAGPMPPMFGSGGTGILLFVLVAAVGYFIWHKFTAISTRLDSLEKEIRKMKSETKGENHD